MEHRKKRQKGVYPAKLETGKPRKIRIPRWNEKMELEAAIGELFICFGVRMTQEDFTDLELTGDHLCENGWVYIQLGTYAVTRNFQAYCYEYPSFVPDLGYFRTVNSKDVFSEYSLTDRIAKYIHEMFLPKPEDDLL